MAEVLRVPPRGSGHRLALFTIALFEAYLWTPARRTDASFRAAGLVFLTPALLVNEIGM
jgi:hypothetical protein